MGAVSSPSGAQAKNKFGAFYPKNVTSGVTNFINFLESGVVETGPSRLVAIPELLTGLTFIFAVYRHPFWPVVSISIEILI